jgi:predicted Zn-dependent protease
MRMKRRNYIAGLASSSFISNSLMFGQMEPLIEKSVNVSFFFGEHFVKNYSRATPSYLKRLSVQAVRSASRTIPNEDQELNISSQKETDYTVDLSEAIGLDRLEVREHSSSELISDFREYLINDVDEKKVSPESNILLTTANLDTTGTGHLHSFCLLPRKPRVSVVQVPRFSEVWNENPEKMRREPSVLSTIVHEFGHNIGLEHNMGKVIEDCQNGVCVTPMLSGYVCEDEYSGSNNYFGNKIPEIPNCDTTQLITNPHFNSRISLSDIKTEQDCDWI